MHRAPRRATAVPPTPAGAAGAASPAVDTLPPASQTGLVGWLRSAVPRRRLNILLTVLIVWFLLLAIPALVEWLLIKAQFLGHDGTGMPRLGRRLLGLHPRKAPADPVRHLSLRRTMAPADCHRRADRGHHMQRHPPFLDTAGWPCCGRSAWRVVAVLMWGGVFGLTYVENERWGAARR